MYSCHGLQHARWVIDIDATGQLQKTKHNRNMKGDVVKTTNYAKNDLWESLYDSTEKEPEWKIGTERRHLREIFFFLVCLFLFLFLYALPVNFIFVFFFVFINPAISVLWFLKFLIIRHHWKKKVPSGACRLSVVKSQNTLSHSLL